MGLLDSLFMGQSSGGGLLDFLRHNAMNQQFNSGLASDQAQYGPMPSQAPLGQSSPLDTAQWPQGPVGAPSQANAQMQPAAPMAAPQPAQNPGTGFLQSLNANFQSMGEGGSLIGALTGQAPNNQTAQFLVSKGIDPGMAKTIAADPHLLRTILPQVTGFGNKKEQPAKVQEYLFAKQEDPTLTYAKFLQKERSTNEYGMQPMYTVNAKGETEAWQLGKDGKPIKVELPAGSAIAKGIEKIDAGTKWIIRDKQTGAVIGEEPKNVVAKEAEEKVGQAKGTAQAALANGADLDAEATKKKIDELMAHKGFDSIFGSIDQYRPAWTMGGDGKDARTRFEQLKGTAFLSAYAMLKGGGAITDIEGQKAGAAMARLDRSLDEADAKQALIDFKEAVDMGLKKLRRAANGGADPGSAPAASGGRSVDDLLKKYGGN